MSKSKNLGVSSREENLSQWYTDTVLKAGLVDYAPVRGSMVIKPHGYAIWEEIQKELDTRFKETGHQNAYFPLLIPESFLKKEAEHVEGFAPEVAWVETAGSEKLEERLAIRPTSEAIICHMYSKWINGYRDLPVLINQWANVMRWEKTTRPFLRTTEFLWQEGHTVHATKEEAIKETLSILEIYKSTVENLLAVPLVYGKKSESEKFAGAVETHTIETILPDGQALQMGTSHYLGTNFAKAFEIWFQDKDEKRKHPHQTSWGVSTRLIGGLVLTHGDDKGLILPPKVSPIQIAIIPIAADKNKKVNETGEKLFKQLSKKGFRTTYDNRENLRPGFKFNDWELKGVPIRIEIGPRDIEENSCVIARRDDGSKEKVNIENIFEVCEFLIEDIQKSLFENAKEKMNSRITEGKNVDEIKNAIDSKLAIWIPWNPENKELEAKIKEKTKATIRCFKDSTESIAPDGSKTKIKALFSRAW